MPRVEEIGWFGVDSVGAAGTVRRAAADAARRLGMTEARIGEVAIAVSEMASNLFKHADDGRMALRYLRAGDLGGIEVISVDAGPGMVDLVASERDGQSTAGTLGIGLGAIARLASWHDAYSLPGRGTVLAARFWPAGATAGEPLAGGLTRPYSGEPVCGDGYAVRRVGGDLILLVTDGLGHGPLAASASSAAVDTFLRSEQESPAVIVDQLHRAIGSTRGAAVAVARLSPAEGLVHYAGLGNIAGHVVRHGERRQMVSLPGIAGHQARTIREFEYPLAPDALVVLHSDGVTDRWDLGRYPGLLRRSGPVVAATILREAGVRRDDACVLVARGLPG